jgi:hypothetical protein
LEVSEVIGVITNHPVVMDDGDLVLVLKVTTGDPPKKPLSVSGGIEKS